MAARVSRRPVVHFRHARTAADRRGCATHDADLPPGRSRDDVHLFAIDADGVLCGIAFLMRGYPTAEVTYLVALVLLEAFQNRSLGPACLERIEGLARSWKSSRLSAVVDSANARALAFWLRHGFHEVGRRDLPDLVGPAICIDKPLDSRPQGAG